MPHQPNLWPRATDHRPSSYNLHSHFRHIYSTRTFVLPVVTFTLLYNVPKFFELNTERMLVREVTDHAEFAQSNETMVVLKPTDLRSSVAREICNIFGL
jgi:hypothetical protein